MVLPYPAATGRMRLPGRSRGYPALTVVQEQLPEAEIIDHLRLSDATQPPERTEIVEPD